MKKISIFVLCLSLAFAWTAFAKTSFAAEKTVVVTDMAQRQVEAPFDRNESSASAPAPFA